jgi:hypothetical protein
MRAFWGRVLVILQFIWKYIVIAAKALWRFLGDPIHAVWTDGVALGILFTLSVEQLGKARYVMAVVWLVMVAVLSALLVIHVRALRKKIKVASTGA